MRLLLDQGLPRGAVPLLDALGHDTTHTSRVGLSTASDTDILRWARRHRRLVVSLDADFHALLALSGARSPSVIRIRIEGLKAAPFVSLLVGVLAQCSKDLRAGAMVTVTRGGIRVHTLPILRPR